MYQFLFFIFFTLAASATHAAETSANYDDNLPPAARQKFFKALKEIPLDEESLSKKESILFVSGQSFTSQGLSVLNRIHYFKRKHFDLWFMKQSAEGKGHDFNQWASLAIFVDKTTKPATAYYVQFQNQPIKAGSPPLIGAFTASCFMCHSSGPRVIRPKQSDLVPSLSDSAMKKIESWNKIIANYRIVQTYKPPFNPTEAQKPFALPGLRDNEIFSHKACVECHNAEDGVRAPLFRQNRGSIEALLDHGSDTHGYYITALHGDHAFMPLEAPKISAQDRQCIHDWLTNVTGRPTRAGCNDKGEAITSTARHFLVDPIHSHLQAVAKTPFGKIKVTHIYLSGDASCLPDSAHFCHAEVRADLRNLQTGIALRDRHLKEKYLDAARYPFAILNLEKLSWSDQSPIDFKAQGIFSMEGTSAAYSLEVSCQAEGLTRKCHIENFQVALSKHHIPQPQFLGAKVSDTINVEGEIDFKEVD